MELLPADASSSSRPSDRRGSSASWFTSSPTRCAPRRQSRGPVEAGPQNRSGGCRVHRLDRPRPPAEAPFERLHPTPPWHSRAPHRLTPPHPSHRPRPKLPLSHPTRHGDGLRRLNRYLAKRSQYEDNWAARMPCSWPWLSQPVVQPGGKSRPLRCGSPVTCWA